MSRFHIVSRGRTYDGMQRCLVRFQVYLENTLTMTQFTEKSTEERNSATLKMDILKCTEGKTAAQFAAMIVIDQTRLSGLKVLFAVSAATPGGRARAIVHLWMGLGQTATTVEHGSSVFQKRVPMQLVE